MVWSVVMTGVVVELKVGVGPIKINRKQILLQGPANSFVIRHSVFLMEHVHVLGHSHDQSK